MWYTSTRMPFRVVVSTCDREPSYIDETLESLFIDPEAATCKVMLAVDGANDDYLQRWKDHPCVSILTLTQEQSAERETKNVTTRIFLNTARALAAAEVAEPLLYCQDDIEFCASWVSKLQECVHQAPHHMAGMRRPGDRYVLCLYAAYDIRGPIVSDYPVMKFYGNQCLYFPVGILAEFRATMQTVIESGSFVPDDMLLKDWCLKSQVPTRSETSVDILVAIPNLVQHVGEETTLGPLAYYHTSPTFVAG